MVNIFSKIKFIWKRPKVIVVAGAGRQCAREAILQVLKLKFRIGKDALVLASDLKDEKELEKIKFLVKKSPLSILVVTHFGEIPLNRDSFAADKEATKEALNFTKTLPDDTSLVLNFDDGTVREIGNTINLKTCDFGFGEAADFRASDVNSNGGTNFKINFKGNIVPVWLEGLFGKEHIYAALAAVCVGTIFDLNLVEVSQSLKDYRGG